MKHTALGLSAQAIAGYGNDHPWDPADLLRCIRFCEDYGLTTDELRVRMAGRSIYWDRLLPEWSRLVALLRHEMETHTDGRAPLTYAEMRRVINDGVKCAACDGTGRGETCVKCKGTGRRGGGRCRADRCVGGADFCRACRGNGFTTSEKAA